MVQYTSSQSSNSSTIDIDVDSAEKSIMYQRSQSRVKQLQFELDVSTEVQQALTDQLREARLTIREMENQLTGSGTIALGEKGLKNLLQISQQKLRQQEKDGELHSERVTTMSKDLKTCRLRLQEMELERALHLEKIDECYNLLECQNTQEGCEKAEQKQKELQDKVLRGIELQRENKSLRNKLEKSEKKIKELKEEEKISKSMVKELKRLLSPELNAKQINQTIDSLKKGQELPTEQAQLLTIQHLKSQIEKLEEEKAVFLDRIAILNEDSQTTIGEDIRRKQAQRKDSFFSTSVRHLFNSVGGDTTSSTQPSDRRSIYNSANF
mmetsp:Transcript_8147/g.12489  ORF Transcript_8147/g.12489 Transcript_8147/m.12489 type:complete len:325 (-) Transcript_8147:78-1052(-)|eukprot:CAMPEP_0178924702 /NCGR_PEP_ID=MMETSP0786-20121207/17474_1 /TAXON_ID=186022 /ORGANISM="Thalassionema frauenfeldii, Strain CCMP 1798" /LENGTH=324 /DNA_ID=CAMNT_0020599443 /DNA_START=180 /DNA_END=1154 /DNA_ORIENTATION=-